MSASVSGRQDRTFYVLMLTIPQRAEGEGVYWFTTLATNRHLCWQAAKSFVVDPDGDWKRELRDKGWVCVRVRIEVVA